MALLMTLCQCWHKLKCPWRRNGKTSPPTPRPGGKGCPKRLVLGKTMFGYRPVKGGGREPLQTVCSHRYGFHGILQESSSGWCGSGRVQPSVQVRFFVTQAVGPRGRAGGTSDHFHPPFKCVFAFSPEVVHVGLEVQLEHVVLVDVLRL